MADMNGQRIGLIADSHGNLAATQEAIRLLRERGAGTLVHLGDFCDSAHRDRSGEMIRLLRENSVLAVKGNNDFFIESILTEGHQPSDPEGMAAAAYLKSVPFTRTWDDLFFAHSLPFDTLRSFYEPIDTGGTQRAARLFAEADFSLLFCGHSHLPILFRKTAGRVTREQVPAGERRVLRNGGAGPEEAEGAGPSERFIVIVGAADNGECAFFDRKEGIYERIRIFGDP